MAAFAFALRSKRTLADGEGFEPSVPFGTHAFQACTIDHSVTHPDLEDRQSNRVLAAFQNLNFLPQLYHTSIRQNAAIIHVRINETIPPENRTGIDHRVATDFSS